MKWFSLFILLEERFIFFIFLIPLFIFLFQGFDVLLNLFPMLFSFLFFQTFSDLCLQSLFLCFFILDHPFLHFHFFFEIVKIFINLFHSLKSFSSSFILLRYFIIKVLNSKLDIQSFLFFLMELFKTSIYNFHKKFIHSLICNLLDSFLQNLLFQLLIINIFEKFSLFHGIVPVGSFLDSFCCFCNDIF